MTGPAGDGRPLTLGAFVGLGTAWSIVVPLSRIAGNEGIPPLIFPLIQALGAVLTLGAAALLLNKLARFGPPKLALSLVSGTFGHGFPQVIAFIIAQKLPIAVVGLVIAMNPVLTATVGALTGLSPVTRRQVLGIVIGFCGVALATLPGAGPVAPGSAKWIAFGLLTPLCFAIANVYSAQLRTPGSDAVVNGLGMMAASALTLSVAAMVFGQSWWPNLAMPGIAEVTVGAHMLNAGLAFFLFFIVLARGGALMVGSASYLILLLATLWGWLFFGERPSLVFYAAAALVVMGLSLVLLPGKDTR